MLTRTCQLNHADFKPIQVLHANKSMTTTIQITQQKVHDEPNVKIDKGLRLSIIAYIH